MSDVIQHACGHIEKVNFMGIFGKNYLTAINHLSSLDCTDCQREAMFGNEMFRYWIVPKDDVEIPADCEDIRAASIEHGRKFGEQIIAKYPDAVFVGAVGLPIPIVISMGIPVNTDVRKLAEEFNCVVYRKIAR